MKCTLEVCVDSVAGLSACVDGGADRIELCSALEVGGLTPSAGLMEYAAQIPLPINAMIRPRAGSFCYSNAELGIMCNDIASAADAGMAGVVFGASSNDNTLDIEALNKLCLQSKPLEMTLHRVLDILDNPLDAVEQAIDLGFNRILTSGGEHNALSGVALLADMQQKADGRIEIMAGAGLTPEHAAVIHKQARIYSFHASCSTQQTSANRIHKLGFASKYANATDTSAVKQFQHALHALAT